MGKKIIPNRDKRNIRMFKFLFFIASIILILLGLIEGFEALYYAGLTMFIIWLVVSLIKLILELDK